MAATLQRVAEPLIVVGVHESGEFIQTLLEHDWLDEFWLKNSPVTVRADQRLFDKGMIPAFHTLMDADER